MADYRAIEAVSKTLVRILASAPRNELGIDLDVRIVGAGELSTARIQAGMGIYLYRVSRSAEAFATHAPAGPENLRQRPMMMVNLHYLLTIWAPDAPTEHRIAGWALSVLENMPVVTGAQLADEAGGVFGADEFVELVMEDLSTRDLHRIIGAVGLPGHRLALPYQVRAVRMAVAPGSPPGTAGQTGSFIPRRG